MEGERDFKYEIQPILQPSIAVIISISICNGEIVKRKVWCSLEQTVAAVVEIACAPFHPLIERTTKKTAWLGEEEVDLYDTLKEAGIEDGARMEVDIGIDSPSAISAGSRHSLLLVEGRAYSFGLGGFGRLGNGDEQDVHVPRLIESVLVGERVVGVAAGGAHTVVWTDKGEAYSFGFGRLGRLGHGCEQDEHTPRLIRGVFVGKRVIGVATGYFHTVTWTDEFRAYSFGWGDSGRLGHGTEEDENLPRLIGGRLTGKKVVGVAAGHDHTIVWSEGGEVYSFGLGLHGRLGHGDDEDEHEPRQIQGILFGEKVVGVAAGHAAHSVVMDR